MESRDLVNLVANRECAILLCCPKEAFYRFNRKKLQCNVTRKQGGEQYVNHSRISFERDRKREKEREEGDARGERRESEGQTSLLKRITVGPNDNDRIEQM